MRCQAMRVCRVSRPLVLRHVSSHVTAIWRGIRTAGSHSGPCASAMDVVAQVPTAVNGLSLAAEARNDCIVEGDTPDASTAYAPTGYSPPL